MFTNPLWVLIYPFFYYFGWNVLMYSYVFGEKEMSRYLEDVGVDAKMKDIYGKNATMLREISEKGNFEKYKISEILKNIEAKVMRGDFKKYTRKVYKKNKQR